MNQSGVADRNKNVAVVTPLFNDWSCLPIFISGLARACGSDTSISLFVVDDGSTDLIDLTETVAPGEIHSMDVLHLGCNLGHQRAIAAGIVEAVARNEFDAIVVIDVDGEDRPEDIPVLLEEHWRRPESIIVAQRRRRSEAVRFKVFYSIYKWIFTVLTGKVLDFGNFVVLPISVAQRMVLMSELWNHFPATVMRTKVRIVKVPLDRQPRSSGQSRMDFTALVNHGLAAIAVFVDIVFVRLLVLTAVVTTVFIGLAASALALRLGTSLAIPGWATTIVGFAILGLIQMLGLLVVVTFLALSTRSLTSPPPSTFVGQYVREIQRIH